MPNDTPLNGVCSAVTTYQPRKTQEYFSNICGRDPMVRYLRKKVIRPGHRVINFAGDKGYTSLSLAPLVRPGGQVVGIERDPERMRWGTQYFKDVPNLEFLLGDVTKSSLPVAYESADVVVSFSLGQFLSLCNLRKMFEQTVQILKSGGKGIFLSPHPRMFESEWKLSFLTCDADDLSLYRIAGDNEDSWIHCTTESTTGKSQHFHVRHHQRENVLREAAEAGLQKVDEEDLWLPVDIIKERFGPASIIVAPATPMFWLVAFQKQK